MADLGGFLSAAGVGSTIGQAVVQLELNTAKYQAELAAAEGKTQASTSSMTSGMSKFSGFAQAAFLGIGAAAVAGIAVSIRAASDLNEQLNKTKVVFGDSAESVIEFSKTSAEAFGISETAALSAAGSFGQILDAAGLAESATSDMSVSLVKLASDLASFNNIDPTEALDKLQSGLAGQARPLREVGVFLSEARVQAEAYKSGIAEVGTELTDAQKIQARYNIILQDTTKAQGDFQRTVGESLPNQMRVLKAELEDTAASIGQSLLPITLELAKALLDLVKQAEPLLEVIGKLAPAVHFLGEAFQFMTSPLIKVIGLIQSGIQPTDEMTQVIGSAAIELHSMQAKAELAAAEVSNLTGDTKKAGKVLKDAAADVETFTLSLDETAKQTIITRKEFVDSTRVMQREANQLNDALKAISKEKWINPEYVKFLSEQGPEWLVGFAKLTEEQQHRAQDAWEESTRKTDKANESLGKISDALDKMDRGTTKHDVEIHYQYVGYDPSKPGMAPGASTGGPDPRQR